MTPDRLPLSSGVPWAALGSQPWPHSESSADDAPGHLRKRPSVLFAGGCVRLVVAEGWHNRPETTGTPNTAVRPGAADYLARRREGHRGPTDLRRRSRSPRRRHHARRDRRPAPRAHATAGLHTDSAHAPPWPPST